MTLDEHFYQLTTDGQTHIKIIDPRVLQDSQSDYSTDSSVVQLDIHTSCFISN